MRFSVFLAATLLTLTAIGCGEDANVVARQVRDYISGVRSPDGAATGALVQGAPPGPTGGPAPSAPIGQGTVINGGTTSTTITSDTEFATILLAVTGAEAYYEVSLPAPVGSAEILLTFSPDVPEPDLIAEYALVDAAGAVGVFTSQAISVTDVPGGDVQVSIAWDTAADLDLHVTDPAGHEISFLQRTSPSGGSLDLDSNSACNRDDSPAESISWPTGGAPDGTYTVLVDQFGACGAESTKYVLTVQRAGETALVFTGVHTSADPIREEHTYTFDFGEGEGGTGIGGACPDAGEFGFRPGDDCTTDEDCPGGVCYPDPDGSEIGDCTPLCVPNAPADCEQCGPFECLSMESSPTGGACELGRGASF